MSRAWGTQHEVHRAVIGVAIDALDYEYNHDARTQSPCLSADRLQLLGDAGSDQETKKISAPSARLSWLRIIREQAASSIVLDSDAWLRKRPREAPRHVS